MPELAPAEQSQVDAFNHAHPIGTPVRYWTGEREGDGKISTTRTAAEILGGHTAVVWVEGEASCIALTHVEPLPDQPDGIEDDSRDLPDPATAAERVNQYICATGDGLYDIQDGAPLYARDLEALTRTATKLPDLQEELSRRTHTLDLVRRELGATREEADRFAAERDHQQRRARRFMAAAPAADHAHRQIRAIRALVEPHREPHATTPAQLTELAINILVILDSALAPVPGSSRRAQEPTLTLDDRDPELADALHAATDLPRSELLPEVRRLVNAQGWDPSSPQHAVIRAAIAWRNGEEVERIGVDDLGLALIEAVDALPHAGESQASEPAGLYGKYRVERVDGRDKHGARYFVLDYVNDPYARAALAVYANVCRAELPDLAADLRAHLDGTREAYIKEQSRPKLAQGGIIRRDTGPILAAERPIDLDDRTPRPDPR